MPRAARLDTPGVLHHVMVRGLERRTICRDDHDRNDFVVRLGHAYATTGARVLAWASMAPGEAGSEAMNVTRGSDVNVQADATSPFSPTLLGVYNDAIAVPTYTWQLSGGRW